MDSPWRAGGIGVICEIWALQVAVIPAKAGIHSANLLKSAICALNSRFRGNDWCSGGPPVPNDTTRANGVTFSFLRHRIDVGLSL
jgi:hypothetical protein